jgi:hypothetical protein
MFVPICDFYDLKPVDIDWNMGDIFVGVQHIGLIDIELINFHIYFSAYDQRLHVVNMGPASIP